LRKQTVAIIDWKISLPQIIYFTVNWSQRSSNSTDLLGLMPETVETTCRYD